jgi:hypothetical protein
MMSLERFRNSQALALAWTTAVAVSSSTGKAPWGWMEPANWICSRSQLDQKIENNQL